MMVTGCTQSNLDLFTYDLVMPPGLESVSFVTFSKATIELILEKEKSKEY